MQICPVFNIRGENNWVHLLEHRANQDIYAWLEQIHFMLLYSYINTLENKMPNCEIVWVHGVFGSTQWQQLSSLFLLLFHKLYLKG